MSEPLRVLHFADLHLGVAGYGAIDAQSGLGKRTQDFLQRLDDVVELAREHEVDLTVFAGDAFHARAPNPTLQREFAMRVQALAALAPLLLLPGRHDLSSHPRRAGSLDIYQTLGVPNVHVVNDYTVQRIETRRGALAVETAPWPQRARLLPDARGPVSAEQLAEALVARLGQLAAQADRHDLPRLLVAHLAVRGAEAGSEAGFIPGDAPLIPLEALADPRRDYVALGHHHRHQNLSEGRAEGPPVVCSGALERIDFSEEGSERGVCLVTLARNATSWRFLPLNARNLRSLQLDLRACAAPNEALRERIAGEALQDVILRLQLRLSSENEAALDVGALRETLRQAGVWHLAGLQREVERPVKAVAGNLEGLDALQLLERYLDARDTGQERRAALLALAAPMLDDAAPPGGPD